MKKWLALHIAVALIGCLAAGWLHGTRTDLVGSAEDYGEFVLTAVATDCYAGAGTDKEAYCAHLEKALNEADTIVRVCYHGVRQPMYQSTLSHVEVREVFKGNAALLGSTIGVYERNFFFARNGELFYRSSSPENLMREGEEYYLFLDDLETPRSGQSGLREYTMDWAWSELGYDLPCRIPCSEEPTILVLAESTVARGEVRFSDVLDADYICANETTKAEIEAQNRCVKQLFGLR